ncbi:MAG: hypothetical protein COB33_014740 [Thiotrichaceae bacterium]|nr:hypothetical protein [Thiotrichaceae bacterium]PCI12932.1 MAG: hypothetical protein COB71_07400 [Thiotrichales bacterium]
MATPANQQQAARIARDLLVRRLPGSRRGSVHAHLQRAQLIAEVIWRRWQVGPYQWQVKHLRWYLVEKTAHLTPGTRYRHWLTVRVLVSALRTTEHWLPQLQGPWLRPTGVAGKLNVGRPVKRPC